MTTFSSRKAVRDAIAQLYIDNDSWESVYSGLPPAKVFAGQSPILTVVSDGTATRMTNFNMNPRRHRFLLANWVLYYRQQDNTTYSEAEDELDTLEVIIVQTIRDNVAGGAGVANLIDFEDTFSDIRMARIETGDVYKVEAIPVTAKLASGSL